LRMQASYSAEELTSRRWGIRHRQPHIDYPAGAARPSAFGTPCLQLRGAL
jgi:hypothetical protein